MNHCKVLSVREQSLSDHSAARQEAEKSNLCHSERRFRAKNLSGPLLYAGEILRCAQNDKCFLPAMYSADLTLPGAPFS